jgi:hypothetical protein
MWLNRELSCNDHRLMSPDVARCWWSLAPKLAPREAVSLANVRYLEQVSETSLPVRAATISR